MTKYILNSGGAKNYPDLAKKFFAEIVKGLSILPIKFLPHYKSSYGNEDSRGHIDWDKALQELKDYKEDFPIHALKEGEYVVIES